MTLSGCKVIFPLQEHAFRTGRLCLMEGGGERCRARIPGAVWGGRMLVAGAVPGWTPLVAASVSAVQRLYGPLRDRSAFDGKENVRRARGKRASYSQRRHYYWHRIVRGWWCSVIRYYPVRPSAPLEPARSHAGMDGRLATRKRGMPLVTVWSSATAGTGLQFACRASRIQPRGDEGSGRTQRLERYKCRSKHGLSRITNSSVVTS